MVACQKCGGQNPDGRVFCGACGDRLDLTGMTSDTFVRSRRRKRALSSLKLIPPLLGGLAVLLVALGVWPSTVPVGKPGTRVGGRRALRQFSALRELKDGRSLSAWLTEEDVNGYFQYFGVSRMEVDSFSVDLQPGYFTVRVVRTRGPFSLGRFEFSPKASIDLVCAPVGARVLVRKARVGHARVPGPFKRIPASRVASLFRDWDERAVVASLSNVASAEDKIELAVRK